MPIIRRNEDLKKILDESRTVAVIGISKDPTRPSHFVTEVVMSYGYKMYLVNPKYEGHKILGEKVYGSIKDLPGEIDIVDVFRRPEYVASVASDAMELGFETFWLQPGTEKWEVIEDLDRKGYKVVPGICLKSACQIFCQYATESH